MRKEQQLLPAITKDPKQWFKEEAEEAQKRLQLFLPFCAPIFRQVPNEIVRSALFTCRNRKTPRINFKKHPIAVIGDGNITYQGEELRQDDETVWMHLLYLAREVQLGEALRFVPHAFLHEIRWPTNGKGYQRLRLSLDRMAATGLTVTSTRLGDSVNVSLIRKIEHSSQTGDRIIPLRIWRVWIEPEIRLLFDQEYLTCIRWETYHALNGNISKKLFLYWSSHKEPFPVKTETLMELCSSQTTIKAFRQRLQEALDELELSGFLSYWKVSKDLWTVKRAKIREDGKS